MSGLSRKANLSTKLFYYYGVTLPPCKHARLYVQITANMAENIYDEVEIEDMTYDPTLEIYHYPCPCGDRFEISIADLRDGEEIAVCPSCSLMIKVIFEVVSRNLGLVIVCRIIN